MHGEFHSSPHVKFREQVAEELVGPETAARSHHRLYHAWPQTLIQATSALLDDHRLQTMNQSVVGPRLAKGGSPRGKANDLETFLDHVQRVHDDLGADPRSRAAHDALQAAWIRKETTVIIGLCLVGDVRQTVTMKAIQETRITTNSKEKYRQRLNDNAITRKWTVVPHPEW